MALIALYARGGSVHEPVHDHDSERLTSTTERHRIPHEIRLMLGNLVAQTAYSRRAELDVLRRSLSQPTGLRTLWACR